MRCRHWRPSPQKAESAGELSENSDNHYVAMPGALAPTRTQVWHLFGVAQRVKRQERVPGRSSVHGGATPWKSARKALESGLAVALKRVLQAIAPSNVTPCVPGCGKSQRTHGVSDSVSGAPRCAQRASRGNELSPLTVMSCAPSRSSTAFARCCTASVSTCTAIRMLPPRTLPS
jgi:hypothetical protein